MDLANRFKNLFHSILSTIIQLLPTTPPPPPPPPRPNHEAAAEYHPKPKPEPEPEPEAPLLANYDQEKLDWAVRMICYCLPPAVSIAIQFLQNQSHELPLAFHFLSLILILSFNFLFLSKFIAPKFPETAKLLERLGVFLAVTAIYIAITVSLPVWLKCMAGFRVVRILLLASYSSYKLLFIILRLPFFPPQQNLEDFSPEICKKLIIILVGRELSNVDVIDVKPWVMNAEVAEKYVCCDSQIILSNDDDAHRFPPTGGFGRGKCLMKFSRYVGRSQLSESLLNESNPLGSSVFTTCKTKAYIRRREEPLTPVSRRGSWFQEIISTLDLVSGDKIKFLLIKAPLKDSYDLARAAFKMAEDFEVSIKLVNDYHEI
ncbi:hypothetical protein LWI29_005599 [Acer saccharum]|uniref:Uncharacterized protein n=1 Tax=Acer saccharum TaxID=4024 RepID=A0AA39RFV2_ACESA|nr:hypothetical protein LWI29_005599 [Acer saccharum]